MELRPNTNNSTVTFGDKSKSEVKSLGKVVVARDITLVNIMLVEFEDETNMEKENLKVNKMLQVFFHFI